jgi:UvrD/REP helicase N-terminal domain
VVDRSIWACPNSHAIFDSMLYQKPGESLRRRRSGRWPAAAILVTFVCMFEPAGVLDLLTELNDEQRQAATHQGGPLLVLAGAGTGKT